MTTPRNGPRSRNSTEDEMAMGAVPVTDDGSGNLPQATTVTPSEREFWKAADVRRANCDGDICARCGRDLEAGEPIWRQQVWHIGPVPICKECVGPERNWWAGGEYFKPQPCEGCQRPVYVVRDFRHRRHTYCSVQCERKMYSRIARECRAKRRELRPCDICGEQFKPTRTDARTCGPRCRQKAYRNRLKWRTQQWAT